MGHAGARLRKDGIVPRNIVPRNIVPRDALRLLIALGFWSGAAQAQAPESGRPLVIPQEVGARQGRVVGRALACGLPPARVEALLRTLRDRMQRAVGRTLTDERYVLALNDAMTLETSLPRPGDEACAGATEAFARLETAE